LLIGVSRFVTIDQDRPPRGNARRPREQVLRWRRWAHRAHQRRPGGSARPRQSSNRARRQQLRSAWPSLRRWKNLASCRVSATTD